MKARFLSYCFLIVFFFPLSCLGQDPYCLEKITVKRSLEKDSDSILSNAYPQQTITAHELEEMHLDSLPGLLDYVAGSDLRSRGPFGVQADPSLLGSTYEQVAILIDGVKLMDPQTGHYNMDIPLTFYDVERVEITKTSGSSLYGGGAFAGSVNIITKKPKKKALSLEGAYGQNVLSSQAFSCSLPGEDFSSRVSFEHKRSKAARPNTDFEYRTLSLYLDRKLGRSGLNALLGWQKKDFGADSFYSNLFPEEEEHTQTWFAKVSSDSRFDTFTLQNKIYLRKHRDKFILNRNSPSYVNYHTTYIYGGDSSVCVPLSMGDLSFGADAGIDSINSTNLGKHSRAHGSGSAGLVSQWSDRINSDIRFRIDHYQKWSWQESYSCAAGYKIIEDKARIKVSFANGFRLPTFTELYYSDPANTGNPELKVEKSHTLSGGIDFSQNRFNLGVDVFLRRADNLIDWTRFSNTEPWRATNLGQVDFMGVIVNSKAETNIHFKQAQLRNVSLSYSYTDTDKKASGFLSKYALDILMHQVNLGLASIISGIKFDWQLSFNKRYYGETYFLGNLYISRVIRGKDFSLEPYLKIDNFTNTDYTEVGGVLQPGRWVYGGVKLEW